MSVWRMLQIEPKNTFHGAEDTLKGARWFVFFPIVIRTQ